MFGVRLSKMGSASKLGLIAKAIGILRKYGADAHIYLPGVGTLNGITAGNYLDSAGTTAASVDNPVGLSLDALQAMTLGSELLTNGAFTTDTSGWTNSSGTIASTGGALTITNGGAVNGLASQIITTVSGKWYLATADFTKGTAVNGAIQASAIATGQYELGYHLRTSSGAMQFIFKAASATTYFCAINESSLNATNTFDNISVREIPGIHATQATTANKPILRRGLLNRLLGSHDRTNANYTNAAVTVPTATRLQETAANSLHYSRQNYTAIAGVNTAVIYAVAAEDSWIWLSLDGASNYTFFNVSTGAIGATTAGTPSITWDASTSSWMCVLQQTLTAGGAAFFTGIAKANSGLTYAGDGTSGVTIVKSGLFQGTLTALEIIDAGGIPLTTSASNPSAGKYSWQFDGSNDSLSLSAPLFQMSDDHCVIAGASTSNLASTQCLFEVGSGATARVCSLRSAAGVTNAVWHDGTTSAIASAASVASGVDFVISGRKTSNSFVCRKNAVAGTVVTTTLSSTTSTAATIGARTDSGTPWAGSIYPIIAIKGTVTDADLLTLERFVGQLSGVLSI